MTKLSTRNGWRFSCGCDPPTLDTIAGAKVVLVSPRYGDTFELARKLPWGMLVVAAAVCAFT